MAEPLPVPPVRVEPAAVSDFARIGELTVAVYTGGGLAPESYVPTLADVPGRAGQARLLVARDPDGAVVGSVALVLSGEFGEVLTSDEEAGFRMLAVDPAVRGAGVGRSLVEACLAEARAAGKRRMVISTDPRMVDAHRLYRRLGFRRLPERDWSPTPGVDLLVFAREL